MKKVEPSIPVMHIRADYTQKPIYVYAENVKIGCQIIPRYVVEQLALRLEFPFPE